MRNNLLKMSNCNQHCPLFAVVVFITTTDVIARSQTHQRLWYNLLFPMWDRPHCEWQIWIFY